MEPATQSQPARPPSAGMADSLFGSLTALRVSIFSSLDSTLEDGDMAVKTKGCCGRKSMDGKV